MGSPALASVRQACPTHPTQHGSPDRRPKHRTGHQKPACNHNPARHSPNAKECFPIAREVFRGFFTARCAWFRHSNLRNRNRCRKISPLELGDTASSHKNRKHSNRLSLVATAPRTPCSRRRTGKRRRASALMPRAHNADK